MTTINQLKSAIIGRVWVNANNAGVIPSFITLPQEMTFSANETYLIGPMTFKTDRNLNASSVEGVSVPVVLPAGSRLNLYANTKRADHKDPDYSASVQLPTDVADTIINNSKRAAEAWKAQA